MRLSCHILHAQPSRELIDLQQLLQALLYNLSWPLQSACAGKALPA